MSNLPYHRKYRDKDKFNRVINELNDFYNEKIDSLILLCLHRNVIKADIARALDVHPAVISHRMKIINKLIEKEKNGQ
jgi:glutamate racemase